MITALLAGTFAAPASAETFIDLFAGKSFPQNTPLRLRADEARINGQIVPADLNVAIDRVRPTNAGIFGARVGHWFGWFGIAGDASTLDPDIKAGTVTATANLQFDESVFGEQVTINPGERVSVEIPRVTVPTTATLSALAMVRLPAERFEPYAFAGPTYLVTDTNIDGDWGLRAGAGVKVKLSRAIALFGEYRYTRVNATAVAGRIGGDVRGNVGSTGDIDVSIRLRNHSAVGGISFSF